MRPSEARAAGVALLLCAAAATAATTPSAHPPPPASHAPCPWDARFVSAGAGPQPAAAFAGIDRRMSIARIVARLGPAQHDVGSGLHVLQWPVADGRWFSVSVPDACSRPMAAGFLPAPTPPPR